MIVTVKQVLTEVKRDCDGTLTRFDFPFQIFSPKDLIVTLIDEDAKTETPLLLERDYTVPGKDWEHGGHIVTKKTYDAPNHIVMVCSPTLVQETSFRNLGRFFPDKHEFAFDRIYLILQRMLGRMSSFLSLNVFGQWDFKHHQAINVPPPDPDRIDGLASTGYVVQQVASAPQFGSPFYWDPDEIGLYADLNKFDDEKAGFIYFATDYRFADLFREVEQSFVAKAGQTDFVVTDFAFYHRADIMVFGGGSYQSKDEWDVVPPNTVKFTTPLDKDDEIIVRRFVLTDGIGAFFIKQSDTAGDWSDPLPFSQGLDIARGGLFNKLVEVIKDCAKDYDWVSWTFIHPSIETSPPSPPVVVPPVVTDPITQPKPPPVFVPPTVIPKPPTVTQPQHNGPPPWEVDHQSRAASIDTAPISGFIPVWKVKYDGADSQLIAHLVIKKERFARVAVIEADLDICVVGGVVRGTEPWAQNANQMFDVFAITQPGFDSGARQLMHVSSQGRIAKDYQVVGNGTIRFSWLDYDDKLKQGYAKPFGRLMWVVDIPASQSDVGMLSIPIEAVLHAPEHYWGTFKHDAQSYLQLSPNDVFMKAQVRRVQ